jgi:hypothetical protein
MRYRRFVRKIRRVREITTRGYGHARSVRERESVDRAGRPLPWYSYASLHWLDQLDLSRLDVFEYGSGNSTRWWAQRCGTLTSVEHDAEWHAKVAGLLPSAVGYRLEGDTAAYVDACVGDYDVIIVDGEHRYDCAVHAVEHLRPGGVIIVDNADWMWNTTAYLRAAGFLQVDFVGPGPINDYAWATSVMLSPGPSRLEHRDRMSVIGGIEQQGAGDAPVLTGRSQSNRRPAPGHIVAEAGLLGA